MDILRNSILDFVGATPMAEITRLEGRGSARLFAKLEFFNPGGSVKDRIALSMIIAAEKSGMLRGGRTVVEPTSGNTGIGLAMVCAVRGYRCMLTMPETVSAERIKILEHFGAEIVLTPGSEGMSGAVRRAESIAGITAGSYMPQQFRNPANPEAHRQTTGPEIWKQSGGKVDVFVAGVGTGGTITGAGEYLKTQNPNLQIVAVEPAASAVLSGNHPGPHGIQGIGAGFVPEILNAGIIDRIITVTDEEAYSTARRLAREEGIFCGVSSGAAVCGALKASGEFGPGKNIAVVLPDTGERYLSLAGAA